MTNAILRRDTRGPLRARARDFVTWPRWATSLPSPFQVRSTTQLLMADMADIVSRCKCNTSLPSKLSDDGYEIRSELREIKGLTLACCIGVACRAVALRRCCEFEAMNSGEISRITPAAATSSAAVRAHGTFAFLASTSCREVKRTLQGQYSTRFGSSETESLRSSPSVPRGAPQCRHLIGVESGALSRPSKTMPSASQFMQTTLKSIRWLIASLAKKQSRQAENDRLTASLVWAWTRGNCPVRDR